MIAVYGGSLKNQSLALPGGIFEGQLNIEEIQGDQVPNENGNDMQMQRKGKQYIPQNQKSGASSI